MTVQIGVQTIIWGAHFDDIAQVLDDVRAIGYRGVEFAQTPDTLGDPQRLDKMLRERGLEFLGLAGGSLAARMEFCLRMQRKPLYLYVQDWDTEEAPVASERGFRLALHPHNYCPIDRLSRALPLLQSHPELLFLPDTAHLWLAADDIFLVLEKVRERLAAVHLKDWTPEYGVCYDAFARGFSELGRGIVPLRPIWEWLQRHWEGWVVVEQDSTQTTPKDSLKISWNWLHGQEQRSGARRGAATPLAGRDQTKPLRALSTESPRVVRALDVIYRDISRGIVPLYATIVAAVGELFDCDYCCVWEASPRTETMSLLGFWPESLAQQPTVARLEMKDSLSGKAVRERGITVVRDLGRKALTGEFRDGKLVAALNLQTMVSIPVLNTFNINQTELLLNLFPKAWPANVSEDTLGALATHIANAVERAWQDLRGRILDEMSYAAARCTTVKKLLETVLERARIHTQCVGASVFLINAAGDVLQLQATTGLRDQANPSEVAYRKGEGLPGKVWEWNHAYVTCTARQCEQGDHRPLEGVHSVEDAVILMPMRNHSGEVVGVIRCRGRVQAPAGIAPGFSLTHEIALDAIQGAVGPHLDRIVTSERRTRAITRTTHELKVPVSVTLGALEFMRAEMKEHHWSFSEDYLGDIEGYMELMRALLGKASFLRPGSGFALDRSKPVLLLADIVAPAVRQVGKLLEHRKFARSRIEYGGVKELPPLYVDKTRFQQVVFNLLSNAIKYAFRDPLAFQVVILGRQDGAGFRIVFRDWGPGIDTGMEESIFLEGVRGRQAHKSDVSGDGVGLWMVREIVQAHGGRVSVTNAQNPTEFQIILPQAVRVPASPRHP